MLLRTTLLYPLPELECFFVSFSFPYSGGITTFKIYQKNRSESIYQELQSSIKDVMERQITYIVTPLGDLDAPHWRAIEALPSGAFIIVCGLRLRDMAARIGRGGEIVHLSGEPMSMTEIAGVLGYPLQHIQLAIAALHRVGLVTGDDEVGWQCTDPVILRHDGRIKQLTAPVTIDDENPKERKKRLARERKQRQRLKPRVISHVDSVTDSVTMSRTVCDKERDMRLQHAEITHEIVCHDIFNKEVNKEVITTTSNSVTSSSTSIPLPKLSTHIIELPEDLVRVLGKADSDENRILLGQLIDQQTAPQQLLAEITRAKERGEEPADYLNSALKKLVETGKGYVPIGRLNVILEVQAKKQKAVANYEAKVLEDESREAYWKTLSKIEQQSYLDGYLLQTHEEFRSDQFVILVGAQCLAWDSRPDVVPPEFDDQRPLLDDNLSLFDGIRHQAASITYDLGIAPSQYPPDVSPESKQSVDRGTGVHALQAHSVCP